MTSILGNLATLGYNVGCTTGAYTLISPLKQISTPKPEYATPDVSSLTDTANIKLPGFVDNGQFSWTMNHSATNLALLGTLAGTLICYEITFPDTHTVTFAAILKSWEAKIERNQLVAWECTAEISGAVTYT